MIDNCFFDFLQLYKIYLMFKGLLIVVEDFDFKINCGEFISLIGYFGCGKFMVLIMVVGLNDIFKGVIKFDGCYVEGVDLEWVVVF